MIFKKIILILNKISRYLIDTYILHILTKKYKGIDIKSFNSFLIIGINSVESALLF